MSRCHHLFWFVLITLSSLRAFAATNDSFQDIPWEEPGPLINFQVTEPIIAPNGSSNQYGCVHTQTLMNHAFTSSYGKPFIGNFTPPSCSFNRVTMNLTVKVKGTQFDRLGIMYLGDTEVFRTSSAEPTFYGIVWTVVKEMEQYTALWNKPQKIIFDWPNNVNIRYTGALNTFLTATFHTVPDLKPAADQIIPISADRSGSNQGSAFMVPGQQAIMNSTFPRNIERAVVSLSACGQQNEEFWYYHVFDKDRDIFANTIIGDLKGHSPFREVQLLIDGQIAGFHWPFPVLFTGGISPGLWRPVAGIDAFDLRQHEIDITPFIPLLSDGMDHTFEIKVVGLNDDGTLSESVDGWWFVTGTIFLFLTEGSQLSRRLEVQTLGVPPNVSAPAPVIQMQSSISNDSVGQADSLIYNVTVTRKLTINGNDDRVSWTQDLSYSSYNSISEYGYTQHTSQMTQGTDLTHPSIGYNNTYLYPLELNSTLVQFGSNHYSIKADLKSGLNYSTQGPSVFPTGLRLINATEPLALTQDGITADSASEISTLQVASAELFYDNGAASYSTGDMDQVYDFNASRAVTQDTSTELYHRHVSAANGMLVQDTEKLLGHTTLNPTGSATNATAGSSLGSSLTQFEGDSPQAMLGRGPGQPRRQLLGVDSAPRRQLMEINSLGRR